MKREVVSIYVDNKANVLSRVVSLYGREDLISIRLQYLQPTTRMYHE